VGLKSWPQARQRAAASQEVGLDGLQGAQLDADLRDRAQAAQGGFGEHAIQQGDGNGHLMHGGGPIARAVGS